MTCLKANKTIRAALVAMTVTGMLPELAGCGEEIDDSEEAGLSESELASIENDDPLLTNLPGGAGCYIAIDVDDSPRLKASDEDLGRQTLYARGSSLHKNKIDLIGTKFTVRSNGALLCSEDCPSCTQFVAVGRDLDDTIYLNQAAPVAGALLVVHAQAGNDTVVGSSGRDYLFGGRGDDTLRGEAGSDWLEGRAGDDDLVGGGGGDVILGDLSDPASFTSMDAVLMGAPVPSCIPPVYGEGDDILKGAGGPDVLQGCGQKTPSGDYCSGEREVGCEL